MPPPYEAAPSHLVRGAQGSCDKNESSGLPCTSMSRRDATRLLGLAAISAGVAFLAIYATGRPHPLYRLIFGIGFLLLGAANLAMLRRFP